MEEILFFSLYAFLSLFWPKFKSMNSGFNLKVLREEDGRSHHPSTLSGGLLTAVRQPTQNRSEKHM